MQHSTSLLMFHNPDVRITGLIIKHVSLGVKWGNVSASVGFGLVVLGSFLLPVWSLAVLGKLL